MAKIRPQGFPSEAPRTPPNPSCQISVHGTPPKLRDRSVDLPWARHAPLGPSGTVSSPEAWSVRRAGARSGAVRLAGLFVLQPWSEKVPFQEDGRHETLRLDVTHFRKYCEFQDGCFR
mmetsp:Transcript_14724/g.40145  ORF Transcript_14724/g.40145 Transcript_14724/m.40145 type:complete len:118 (-) Transcript_14724:583-936(-)